MPVSATTRVRLGHAIMDHGAAEDGALRQALGIISGAVRLEARPPTEKEAVSAAEAILCPGVRPVYAYMGLLHKKLGTVGVIFSPQWAARCACSVSRCDSGGLMGGFGGFACVKERTSSLEALSYGGANLVHWESDFSEELSSSYRAAEADYVRGVAPDTRAWNDARVECIEFSIGTLAELDRRLWTWEAQLSGSPLPHEVECLVLSPEMYKKLEVIRTAGQSLPSSVRILPGAVTSDGVDWFDADNVHAAFLGT